MKRINTLTGLLALLSFKTLFGVACICTAMAILPNSAASQALTKQIAATNEAGSPETGDGSAGNERLVLIGEVVTYRLVLEVPEGTQNNVSIVDNLPAGMQYVDGSAAFTPTANSTLSYSTTVNTVPALSFELGNLTNSDNDADVETLEIQYQARVANTTGNQSGAMLPNSAMLYFGASLISTSESRTVQVTEPVLQVSKEQRAGYNGPFITGGDAGDEYVYTVRINNTGNAPAYDVKLTDFIPKDFIDQYGTLITTGLNGFGFIYNSSSGEWNYQWTAIAAGGAVSATLRVRVKNTVRPSDSWDNTVNITYSSLPGVNANERTGADGIGGALNDYVSTATSPSFSVPVPAVAKQVEHPSQTPIAGFFNGAYTDSSSDPGTNTGYYTGDVDAAIGETFSYIITVTFPEGTTADFTMIDLASPNGQTGGRQNRVVDMLSAEVIHVGPNLSGGGVEPVGTMFLIEDSGPADGDGTRSQLWVGGGRDVLNTPDNVVDDNDRYVIRIIARMDDEDESGGPADAVPGKSNNAGNVTGNRLQYQWRNSANTQFTNNEVADVEIVEPALTLAKAVTATNGYGTIAGGNLSNARPGDEVTFSMTIANNGNAPAYDVNLTDNFDAVFDLTSVSLTAGTDNSDLANDAVNVDITSIPAGSSVTVTAVAVIRNTATGGASYTNTANVASQSQPGSGADIRAYSASSQASVHITNCQVTISQVETAPEACPNANDGSIVITASTNSGSTLSYQLSGPIALSNDNGIFTGLPDGSYTVTASDGAINGCQATQMNIVVAEGVDNTPPTANCVSELITIQLDESGTASLLASGLDNGSTDNCSETLNFAFPDGSTQINFDCDDVNTTSYYAVAVFDAAGNTASCSFTVTVSDTEAPAITFCPSQPNLSVGSNCEATIPDLTPLVMFDDNCDDNQVVISQIPAPGTAVGPGTYTLVLTVTDGAGNSDNCSTNIVVADNTLPQCTGEDIFVSTDPGQCTAVVNYTIPTASDNCPGAVIEFTSGLGSGAAFPKGLNDEVYTVTDAAGNTNECYIGIVVTDGEGPTALCQNITVSLDANGAAQITPQQIDNGSSDNCNLTLSASPLSFDCGDLGANTVTLTVFDGQNLPSTCEAIVTIVDEAPPIAQCKDATIELDENGYATLSPDDINNNSFDACSSVSLSLGQMEFDCSHLGTNTVTLYVTDIYSNTSSCTANVTIDDVTPPVITCKDITVQLGSNGQYLLYNEDVEATAYDNCGLGGGIVVPNLLTCANAGQTLTVEVIRADAYDVDNNQSSCWSQVTVLGGPVALCRDITAQVDANGQASITIAQINDGSYGTCAPLVGMSLDRYFFDCFPLGPRTVTLTALDAEGRTSTCEAIVTVEDNIPPVAACEDITVALDNTGTAYVSPVLVGGNTSDNCQEVGINLSQKLFDCSHLGDNTVTLTATDGHNTATCTATVTVVETPTAICKNLVVASLDENGHASVSAASLDDGSSSPCGGALSFAFEDGSTQLGFDCSEVNTTSYYILVVTGPSGNTSTCFSQVSVRDDIAPTANCKDVTVELDASGTATYADDIINDGSTDNCGIVSVQAQMTTVTCAAVGSVVSTFTATDAAGNSSSCTGTITIVDAVAPTFIDCPGDQTFTSLDGQCGAFVEYTALSVSDNCGNPTVTLTEGISNPGFFPVGSTTQTYVAVDVSGNSSVCSFTITITDDEAPAISCPGDIDVVASSAAGAVVNYTAPAGTDNCGAATVQTAGLPSGAAFPIGATVNTFVATDDAGNSSACSFTVTVAGIAPEIACPATITVNNTPGQCDAPASFEATETVGIPASTITYSHAPGSTFPVGTTTVTATATNAVGSSSCTFEVTVADNELPTVVCPANISASTDQGACNAVVHYTAPTGTDNCPGATTALTGGLGSGLAFPPGATIETYTTVDAAGNTASCSFTVTVTDNEAPTALCQDVTVQLDANGQYTLQESDVLDLANSYDNCSFSVNLISPAVVYCEDFGITIPVMVSIADPSGNAASCLADVYVDKSYSLPVPWAGVDIGDPGAGNSYQYGPCQAPPAFTITANANNNTLGSDNLGLIGQELCGDFELTVRVQSITPKGYAGLVARESSEPGSKMVGMYSNRSSVLRWESRSVSGANKALNFFPRPAPNWLKLKRQGDWFIGYYSSNGLNFSIVSAQMIPMGSCLEAGLGAFTNINGIPAVAVFSNVSVSGGGISLVQLPPAAVKPDGIGRNISLYPNPARDVVSLTRTSNPGQPGQALSVGEELISYSNQKIGSTGAPVGEGLISYSNQKIGGTGAPAGRPEVQVQLYNELGQVLQSRQWPAGELRMEWPVQQLAPGIYFFEVTEDGQAPQVLKFVRLE
ncbi:MAG: HYR domain-containing protein [Lewinellaceae bacterium]|nr:HYR domain-containing protein [Lewinellaceae bacterium]